MAGTNQHSSQKQLLHQDLQSRTLDSRYCPLQLIKVRKSNYCICPLLKLMLTVFVDSSTNLSTSIGYSAVNELNLSFLACRVVQFCALNDLN